MNNKFKWKQKSKKKKKQKHKMDGMQSEKQAHI